jgi:hypothetical protein
VFIRDGAGWRNSYRWHCLMAIVQAYATVFSDEEADLARVIADNFKIHKTVKNRRRIMLNTVSDHLPGQ